MNNISHADVSPTELAYAAGIIDGEGCICCKMKADLRFGVTVTNTSSVLMEWLAAKFGGYTGVSNRSLRHDNNHKTSYHWELGCRASRNFLRLIFPYLLLKRRQAELVLESGELLVGNKFKRHGISTENRMQRQKIADEISALNRRGKVAKKAGASRKHES